MPHLKQAYSAKVRSKQNALVFNSWTILYRQGPYVKLSPYLKYKRQKKLKRQWDVSASSSILCANAAIFYAVYTFLCLVKGFESSKIITKIINNCMNYLMNKMIFKKIFWIWKRWSSIKRFMVAKLYLIEISTQFDMLSHQTIFIPIDSSTFKLFETEAK